MDLRKIVIGLCWIVMANLVFYFMYPIFGSLIDGMSTAVIGSFGMTSTMTSIGWGAYFLIWGLAGLGMPIYMIVSGASRD